jgi:membrane protease YdiL (CAAX protease family)
MSNPTPEAAADPTPLVLQPLDIQHDTDPADDHGPARRIPHLGHAVLFFSLTMFIVFLCINSSVDLFASILHTSPETAAKDHPLIELVAQIVGYVLTLLVAAWIFPRLWERSFLHGLQWNILALHRRWLWLLLLGIVLSISVQLATPHLMKMNGHAPVERLFTSAHSAWITASMAVLFGPLMEEIAFRGFLLPALATAYDWLSIERTPAGLARWQNTSGHTTAALVFASIFASIPFALIHAPQISFAWGVVAVLYGVSLVLSFVRIRTHSVACSTFVHAVYNFVIFAALFASTGGFRHMELLAK